MTTFYLNKDAGRALVLENVTRTLARLDAKKSYKVEITEHRKSRTEQQNKALFGLAYAIMAHDTGYTVDELHEAMCKRFWGTVEREVMGQLVTRPYRTTTTGPDGKRDVIGWDVFSEFYAAVENVAGECGIKIPPPDPLWKEAAAKEARARLREAA